MDLLHQAGAVHIPPKVESEITYHCTEWKKPPWISVVSLEEPFATHATHWYQSGLIDPGESEAIALTQQLEADWFLTDDAAARLLAQSIGLEVHGSLGIVLWSAAVGLLDKPHAEETLQRLAQSSLWISSRVLAKARDALQQLFDT